MMERYEDCVLSQPPSMVVVIGDGWESLLRRWRPINRIVTDSVSALLLILRAIRCG